jgi:hypothetical protein
MRLPRMRWAKTKESRAAAATAESGLAASAAKPGTSNGQRRRPITWTTAAAMPTGTATRIARWLESRPTPIAMGANNAAETANTANQNITAFWEARNLARTSSTGSLRTSG